MSNFQGSEMVLIGLGILLYFIPKIFYVLTVQKTLNLVSKKNQKIVPELLWLYLIPIVGTFFYLIMIILISDSFKWEFREREIRGFQEKPGFTIGLVSAILFLTTWIPLIGMITLGIGMICWVIHWVKVVEIKKALIQAIENDPNY